MKDIDCQSATIRQMSVVDFKVCIHRVSLVAFPWFTKTRYGIPEGIDARYIGRFIIM